METSLRVGLSWNSELFLMIESDNRAAFIHLPIPLQAVGLIPSVAIADFSSPVVSVLNGDTIEVLRHARAERD